VPALVAPCSFHGPRHRTLAVRRQKKCITYFLTMLIFVHTLPHQLRTLDASSHYRRGRVRVGECNNATDVVVIQSHQQVLLTKGIFHCVGDSCGNEHEPIRSPRNKVYAPRACRPKRPNDALPRYCPKGNVPIEIRPSLAVRNVPQWVAGMNILDSYR
jgi:hypothetical protein